MTDAYRPPFPGWRGWAAGALLAALLGGLGYAYFDRLAARRVADGVAVEARVTAVRAIPVQRIDLPQLVTVAYRFDGGTRTARLAAPLFAPNHQVGDVLTVYLEPDGPERVATGDGLASEGLLLLVPPAMVFYGLACLVIVGAGRLRWWLRHERAGSDRVATLTVNGLVADDDRLLPWSRALQRLMASAVDAERAAGEAGVSGQGDDAGLRMYLVYRVPADRPRRPPGAPRAVWYSRRRRRVTVEAVVVPSGADPEREVPRLLREALRVAEASGRRHGIDPSDSRLDRVVQATVDSYQSRR